MSKLLEVMPNQAKRLDESTILIKSNLIDEDIIVEFMPQF